MVVPRVDPRLGETLPTPKLDQPLGKKALPIKILKQPALAFYQFQKSVLANQLKGQVYCKQFGGDNFDSTLGEHHS